MCVCVCVCVCVDILEENPPSPWPLRLCAFCGLSRKRFRVSALRIRDLGLGISLECLLRLVQTALLGGLRRRRLVPPMCRSRVLLQTTTQHLKVSDLACRCC